MKSKLRLVQGGVDSREQLVASLRRLLLLQADKAERAREVPRRFTHLPVKSRESEAR